MVSGKTNCRLLIVALVATVLSACSGGGAGGDATVVTPAPPPSSGVVVTGVVSKGPLDSSDLEFLPIDAFGAIAGAAVATATTAADGSFVATIPQGSGALLIRSRGGSYVDEADREPDPALKRRVLLGADDGIESLLPAGTTSVTLTIATQSLLDKTRRETQGNNFLRQFNANRALATSAFGFDIVTTPATNPVSPDPAAPVEQRQYAMVLGGLANLVNRVTLNAGLVAPTIETILAVAEDFSDGRIDGLVAGVPVMVGNVPIEAFSLNEEITRFRNNNFDSYAGTPLIVVDEAVFSQTGVPVNTTPVAVADDFSLDAGGTIDIDAPGVLGNDTDADGDALIAVLETGPGNAAAFSFEDDGSFLYTHDGSSSDPDSFSYLASDGISDSNIVTVTLNIENSAPIANDDSGTALEGGLLLGPSVLANDTDFDGDDLSAALVDGPLNGQLLLNPDGTFEYTHNGSETTGDEFTYIANDGARDSNIALVQLTITPVNDEPVGNADSATVDEGDNTTVLDSGAISVLNNDTDAEMDSLTAVLATLPVNGQVIFTTDGTFNYSHDGSETTSDSFTYIVSDGSASSAPVAVDITVVPVNDAPVTEEDFLTVDQDSSQSILDSGADTVLANDSDAEGDALSVMLVDLPFNGQVNLNPDGTFEYFHDGSPTQDDEFTYVASDGTDDSVVTSVFVQVVIVNTPPVAEDDSFTVDEGGNQIILDSGDRSLLDNDFDDDGDDIDAILLDPPANGMLELNPDGTFSYTHDGSETTSDSFTYVANDGIDDSDLAVVSIVINPVNDDPVGVADSITLDQGETATVLDSGEVSVLANDTDAENDILTAILDTGPINGDLSLSDDGTFSYTHDGSATTTDSFTYIPSDAVVRFSTTVESATGANAASFTPGEPVTISYLLDPTIPDLFPGDPSIGQYPVATQQITFEFPNSGITIDFGVGDVQVFDDTTNPDDQIFIFAVENFSSSQLGGDNVIDVELDYVGLTSMVASDALPRGLPGDIQELFAFFELTGGRTTVNFDVAGITRSVRNTRAATPVQVDITINPPNQAPIAINLDNDSVQEGLPAGTSVGTFTTEDPDIGDTHTYSLVAGAGDDDNALFQIVGDQLQTATVLDSAQSTRSILVQTEDQNGGLLQQLFVITVNPPPNNPPTAIDLDNDTVDEGEPPGTTVGLFSTTDPDVNDIHIYTLVPGVGDDGNAFFTIDDGELLTDALLDAAQTPELNIRVQTDDQNGGTFEETFVIFVNDVPNPRTWINPQDGAWTDPANWSPFGVPEPGDAVLIDLGIDDPVITITSAFVDVGSIECAETLVVDESVLIIRGFGDLFGTTVLQGDLRAEGPDANVSVSGAVTLAGSLLASNGGRITIQDAPSYSADSPRVWSSAGAGSAILLADTMTITVGIQQDTGATLSINATNGGLIDLPVLTDILADDGTGPEENEGWVDTTAFGAGAQVLMPQLLTYRDLDGDSGEGGLSIIEAISGGDVVLPLLTAPTQVRIMIDSDSSMDVAQLVALTDSVIELDGGTFAFPNLTNLSRSIVRLGVINAPTVEMPAVTSFNSASVELYNGTVLSLPGVTNYFLADNLFEPPNVTLGFERAQWIARDTGSRLELPNLLTGLVAGDGNAPIWIIEGSFGGVIDMPSLTSLTVDDDGSPDESGIFVSSAGSPFSRVSMPQLTTFSDSDPSGTFFLDMSQISMGGGGAVEFPLLTAPERVLIALGGPGISGLGFPQLTSLTNGGLDIDGGGDGVVIDFSNLADLTGSTVYVRGGATADLSAVTMFDNGGVEVYDGVTQSFPGVTSYTFVQNVGFEETQFWYAEGAASRLEFPNLISAQLAGVMNGPQLEIQGFDGGTVALPMLGSLAVFDDGSGAGSEFVLRADGTNSLVDLPVLTQFTDDDLDSISTVIELNAGVVNLPGIAVLTNVEVNGNQWPTAIALDSDTVDEGLPSGEFVGQLSTTDPDPGDSHVYSLVPGPGSDDNASFDIIEFEGLDFLITADTFDAGQTPTLSVRIQSDDENGGTFEQAFTIFVDAQSGNNPPTAIDLDNDSVVDFQAVGTLVGTLTTTDPDQVDTHSYSLVAGVGSDDNASFQIAGDQLQTAALLNADQTPTLSVRIETDDQNGGTFEQAFTINVISTNTNLVSLSLTDVTLDSPFNPGQIDYTATVPFTVTSTQVTAETENAGATLTINGMNADSGVPSVPIALNTGSNTITTVVTDEAGTSTRPYTVTVTRESAAAFAQQSYIKASNTEVQDQFGEAISLSGDGNTLAVGSQFEDSAASGINGNQNDNSAPQSGAVYVFSRDGAGAWTQQAYIKASNTDAEDNFGWSVALSSDGNTLAVSAPDEDSLATGINGDQNDNSGNFAGAVYVYTRDGAGVWTQQAYVKASNTETTVPAGDEFGFAISLSGNGDTLAVGARKESSAATGIDGNQNDNSAVESGAAYVYTRDGAGVWTQQAYIKASNTEAGDLFGESVSVSGDGNTLAVGTIFEDSAAVGINDNQNDNSASAAGAVYVYTRDGAGVWSQQAYVKASNTDPNDRFGFAVALANDGNTLAVGAEQEDSAATGVNGNQNDNSAFESGAVYVYTRDGAGVWTQQAYVKASNTDGVDLFGRDVTLSADGNTLAVGTPGEDSAATGIDGDQIDNSLNAAGAVYVYTRDGVGVWTQLAYIKASNTELNDQFGHAVSAADDGTLAVSALFEGSAAAGIDGDQSDNNASFAGAVYVFALPPDPADPDLGTLTLSDVMLDQTFDMDQFDYTATVPFTTTSTEITPTAVNGAATIMVNGMMVSSGQSITVTLVEGANVITIIVTSADGSTSQTYTVTITVNPMIVTRTWINPLDGDWTDPANWSPTGVPQFDEAVVIDLAGADPVITISGIEAEVFSIDCTETIVIDAPLVINGPGSFSGTTILNESLLVNSSDGSVTIDGQVDIGDGNLIVLGGAVLSIPALSTYFTDSSPSWFVADADSRLQFPNLATLTVGMPAADLGPTLEVDANDGGVVDLPALTSISVMDGTSVSRLPSFVDIRCQNGAARVQMPLLNNFSDQDADGGDFGGLSALVALNECVIDAPLLTAPVQVNIAFGGTSVVNLPQLTSLTDGILSIGQGNFSFPNLVDLTGTTVSMQIDATADFSAVTSIDSAELQAFTGSNLSLPGVTSYLHDDRPGFPTSALWIASGANSVIDLPNLASIQVGVPATDIGPRLELRAQLGGVIDVPSLTAMSVLDGDSLNARRSDIEIIATEVDSVINMVSLVTFEDTDTRGTVDGASSLVARDGGTIQVPLLTDIDQVNLTLDSVSLIDIAQIVSLTNGELTLEDGDFAFPNLVDLTGSTVRLGGTGIPTTANFDMVQAFDNGACEILDGSTLSLPSVVSYLLTERILDNDAIAMWSGSGSGSLIELSNLASIQVGEPAIDRGPNLRMSAQDGAVINLPILTSMAVLDGESASALRSDIDVQTGGFGGLVQMPSLTSFIDADSQGGRDGTSALESFDESAIIVPLLTAPDQVSITIDQIASISVSQLTSLTNGVLQLLGASVAFPNLVELTGSVVILEDGAIPDLSFVTEFSGGGAEVNNGSFLSLPGVTDYLLNTNNFNDEALWQSNGFGSQIVFPALTTLQVGPTDIPGAAHLDIEAVNSGSITLSQLGEMTVGNNFGPQTRDIDVLADGPGSLVEFPVMFMFFDFDTQTPSTISQLNNGLVTFPPTLATQNVIFLP